MHLGYTGEVALVTGATRGIGAAVARSLLEEGCRVVIGGSRESSVAGALADLERFGERVSGVAGDVSADGAAGQLVQEAVEKFGQLDVLVNNAAGFDSGHFETIGVDEWLNLLRLKLVGYAQMTQAALPHLIRNSGAVLNVAGVAALVPSVEAPHVGPTNAGVLNLTRLLAREYGPRGLRVNALTPGMTATDRMTGRAERLARERSIDVDDAVDELSSRLPTGHPVDPEELGRLAAVMCSPRFPSLTGAHLVVDGGYSTTAVA